MANATRQFIGSTAEIDMSGVGFITSTANGSFAQGFSNQTNATISATGIGSFAQGFAKLSGAYKSNIIASNQGSLARGYTYGKGGNSYIQALGKGSFVSTYIYNSLIASLDMKAYKHGCFVQGYGKNAYLRSGGGVNAYGAFAQGFAKSKYNINACIDAGSAGSFARGYVYTTAGVGYTACINAFGEGGFASGYVKNTQNSYSGIYATKGSFAQGCVYQFAYISASGLGSFAQGYATYSSVSASGKGSFAQGIGPSAVGDGSFAQGTFNISSTEDGSFAQGYTYGNYAQARIASVQKGSFAQGFAFTSTTYSASIYSKAKGSFARGYVKATTANRAIYASGKGSFAHGFANDTDIKATADGAIQFGPGTNTEANSLQVGAGPRIFAGVPGTPQNGDIWLNAGYVYIRTNGVSKKIT